MTLTPHRRCLLLTFDAFETLFHPRHPIPESYAAVARAYGLNGPAVAPTILQSAFKKAYKAQSRQFPNYGRNMVLRGEYGGPKQWWTGVIEATFANALGQPHSQLPEGMVDTLIETFASQQGYSLYEDVQSCFDKLKDYKTRQSQFECVVTGIVSNSDDRVPTVLESLGLSVGGTRADQDRSSTLLPGFEGDPVVANPQTNQNINSSDLNMIITSYEAGEEKPDRLIYDVAARQADRLLRSIKPAAGTSHKIEWLRIHVGDDFEKDFQGAKSAGWHGILLDRDREFAGNLRDMEIIHSLEALLPLLERYATS